MIEMRSFGRELCLLKEDGLDDRQASNENENHGHDVECTDLAGCVY